MNNYRDSKFRALLPLALVILIIFIALCSGFKGLNMSILEASVDEEKLGVSMNGNSCFIYLADINSIELMSAVPNPIPDKSITYLCDSSGVCISVQHEDGLLLFNLSNNNNTEKIFVKLNKAIKAYC